MSVEITLDDKDSTDIYSGKFETHPESIPYTKEQLESIINIFDDRIAHRTYDDFSKTVEGDLDFNLGEKAKFVFDTFGCIRAGVNFTTGAVVDVVEDTKWWRQHHAKTSEINKYVMFIHDDAGDVFVDNGDNVYVAAKKDDESYEISNLNEDIITFICKRILKALC